MCTEDAGGEEPLATIVLRAGHKAEWTLILKTTNQDKAQICCARPSLCVGSSYTPLRLMEGVMDHTILALGELRGRVRGSPYLDEVRTLCLATRNRILAEDSAE